VISFVPSEIPRIDMADVDAMYDRWGDAVDRSLDSTADGDE
jgi:hypothetical protein